MDPYYPDCQIAHFKSYKSFEKVTDNYRCLDQVMQAMVFMSISGSSGCEVKLLSQYFDCYCITNIAHDSNEPVEFDIESIDFDGVQKINEVENMTEEITPIPIKMDKRGFMYYIEGTDGRFIIKQLKPVGSETKSHLAICEVKANNCLGFDISDCGQYFFFIDEQKTVFMLSLHNDRNELVEDKLLYLKFKDQAHFKMTYSFNPVIIRQQYLIYNSKIFYLYSDEPHCDGILDMEKLNQGSVSSDSEIEIMLFQYGPLSVDGNNEFLVVYENQISSSTFVRFYQQPDSCDVTMIPDFQQQCEFSTFLWNGDILLQVRDRFMVFDQTGKFMYQAHFADMQTFGVGFVQDFDIDDGDQSRLMQMSPGKTQLNNSMKLSGLNVSIDDNYYKVLIKQRERPQSRFQQYSEGMATILEQEFGSLVQGELSESVFDQSSCDRSNESEKELISCFNRMKLLRISKDNKCYLFEDKLEQKLKVYNLDCKVDYDQQGQKRFFFRPLFTVDIMKLKILNNFILEKERTFQRVLRHILTCGHICITNNGWVVMTFNTYNPRARNCKFEIYGSIIKIGGNDGTGIREFSFNDKMLFYQSGINEINTFINKQIVDQLNLLQIETMKQQNLPDNLKDGQRIKQLNLTINELRQRLRNIVCSDLINDSILIVYCGRLIRYAFVKQFGLTQKLSLEFVKLNLKLHPKFEIIKVWGTDEKRKIQIVGKDLESSTFVVLTWDVIKNMEVSMFQIPYSPDTQLENYLVRGMNLNCNYLVHSHVIFDLCTNLPVQTAHGHSMSTVQSLFIEQNVRKIFKDSSRMLAVDNHNVLRLPSNRMDYLLWKNIQELGHKPTLIDKSTELEMFSRTFNGQSFYHIFALNSDIIQVLYDKYFQYKLNDKLEKPLEFIPLTMLNQNENGNTALELAHISQRPRSFELLIHLLSQFNDFPYSKHLVTQFLKMIRLEVVAVDQFFENLIFRPHWMKEGVTIPWETDQDEYVFGTHTSILNEETIKEEQDYKSKPESLAKVQKFDSEQLKTMTKFQMRKFVFMDQHQRVEEQVMVTRIGVSIINFEWIFEDNNAEVFLNLLVNMAKKSVFKHKSVKAFINILWKQYQPTIVKRIFYPYCFYLITQMVLSSGLANAYYHILSLPIEQQSAMEETKAQLGNIINSFSVIAILLWAFFFYIEMRQVVKDPIKYLTDMSNLLDLCSQMTSISFQMILQYTALYDVVVVPIKYMVIWGGFACMLLWIRMFKWMRLFKETAHFITLLSQVVDDLKIFNIMWLIVMAAFGNFFYAINYNSEMTPESHYVGQYTYIEVIDPIIQMYLYSLGEFDMESFKGPNTMAAYTMFILATFVLNVIFQNLIISIIENSFQKVQAKAEEYGLYEQAKLVRDMLWIKDIKFIFKNDKYIVLLEKPKPDLVTETEEDLSELQQAIIKKQQQAQQQMSAKLSEFEKSNRSLAKQIYTTSLKQREKMIDQEAKVQSMDRIMKQIRRNAENKLSAQMNVCQFQIPENEIELEEDDDSLFQSFMVVRRKTGNLSPI